MTMQSPTTEIAAADTNEELLLELVETGLNREVNWKAMFQNICTRRHA